METFFCWLRARIAPSSLKPLITNVYSFLAFRAFFPVRVKGGMSLRNGMWHSLRNDIIMRNLIYADRFQRNKLNWKERPFLAPINLQTQPHDDNQKTTKAHCRPALKDSSSIEEKMFSKVTLPSTLIFSAKDVCTINLTVSCYLYLYSKPCEKCFFMRLWVTWSWHNW